MSFNGRDPVRTNTVIDNKIIEQVKMLNFDRGHPVVLIQTIVYI